MAEEDKRRVPRKWEFGEENFGSCGKLVKMGLRKSQLEASKTLSK
jgi:hypothetical protein